MRPHIESRVELLREISPIEKLRAGPFRIRIRTMRHGQKESTPGIPDTEVKLTANGRAQAHEFGKAHSRRTPVRVDGVLAAGSSRLRTRQTAAHAALAELGVTNVALDDEALDAQAAEVGLKTRGIEAMDFEVDGSTPYGQAFNAAFSTGKYLSFLVHESDKIAEKTGAKPGSSTYSSMAGNLSRTYLKYVDSYHGAEARSRKKSLAGDAEKLRVFGTHSGVPDSFLLKAAERVLGAKERDALLAVIGDQGFGFAEGFDADVEQRGKEVVLHVRYAKDTYALDILLTKEQLEAIAEEGGGTRTTRRRDSKAREVEALFENHT